MMEHTKFLNADGFERMMYLKKWQHFLKYLKDGTSHRIYRKVDAAF